MPDTDLGYKDMKKFLVSFVALSALAVSTLSLSQSSVTAAVRGVEGAGDGHCTACGLSNGHYRCAAFSAKYNHPSECTCGHSKSSHANR